MRVGGHLALALTSAAVLTLVAAPTAAMADTDEDVALVYTQPSVTVEYGQYWMFYAEAASSTGFFLDPQPSATLDGAPGYVPEFYRGDTAEHRLSVTISPSGSQPALGAGSYTPELVNATGIFSFQGETTHYHLVPPTAPKLTISPAALAVDFRILSDTVDRDGAIVSARLTGAFADQYAGSGGYVVAGVSPGGSWTYEITDSTGDTVLAKTLDTAAGDSALATSFYWSDAEPGESYSATVVFTPDTSSAANFAISQAADFAYTAPEAQRPVPQSTVAPTADDAPAPSAEFSLPLWALVLIALFALGLAVTVVLLALRYVRTRQDPPDTRGPASAADTDTTTKEMTE